MRSVPTWEALKKENQLRAQRKRVAVGEEEQSGLCSDVGCVDKKDTIIQSHIREQYYLANARTDMINEENDIIMGNI